MRGSQLFEHESPGYGWLGLSFNSAEGVTLESEIACGVVPESISLSNVAPRRFKLAHDALASITLAMGAPAASQP